MKYTYNILYYMAQALRWLQCPYLVFIVFPIGVVSLTLKVLSKLTLALGWLMMGEWKRCKKCFLGVFKNKIFE